MAERNVRLTVGVSTKHLQVNSQPRCHCVTNYQQLNANRKKTFTKLILDFGTLRIIVSFILTGGRHERQQVHMPCMCHYYICKQSTKVFSMKLYISHKLTKVFSLETFLLFKLLIRLNLQIAYYYVTWWHIFGNLGK